MSVGEWEEKYNALQKQFDEFQEQSEEFEQELEQDKKLLEIELEQKEQAYDKLLKEKNRIDDQLHRERETHSNSTSDISKYLDEIKSLKAKNIKYKDSVQKLETSNDNYENSVRALTQDLANANSKLEECIEENIFLKNDLEDAKREYVDNQEHLLLEIKEHKDEIEHLKRSINGTRVSKRLDSAQPSSSVASLKSHFESSEKSLANSEDTLLDDILGDREVEREKELKLRDGSEAELPPPPMPPVPSGILDETESTGHDTIEEKEQELSDLRLEVEELSVAMDEMSGEMEHLTEELQSKSNVIKNLELQLNETQNLLLESKESEEKLLLKAQGDVNDGEVLADVQAKLLDMTKKYNESCTMAADLMTKVSTLENDIKEGQSRSQEKEQSLGSDLSASKSTIKALREDLERHQVLLETHEKLHNDTIEKHELELKTVADQHIANVKVLEQNHIENLDKMKTEHDKYISTMVKNDTVEKLTQNFERKVKLLETQLTDDKSAHQLSMEHTIDKYEKLISEHSQVVQNFEKQLEDVEEQRQNELASFASQKQDLESTLNSLHNKVEAIKAEANDQTAAKSHTFGIELAQVKAQLKEEENARKEWQNKHDEVSAELTLKVNKLADQQTLIEKQNISIAQLQTEKKKISERHNQEISAIQSQYEDTHEECANLELQVNELNSSLIKSQDEYKVSCDELKIALDQCKKYESMISKLNDELKEREGTVTMLQEQVKAIHAQHKSSIQDTESKYIRKVERLNKQLEELKNEHNNDGSHNNTSNMELQIQSLQEDLEKRRETIELLQNSYSDLQGEKDAHEEDVLHLQSQIRMLTIKSKKLEYDLSESREEGNSSQDNLYAEINELKLENAKLSKTFSKELSESELRAKHSLTAKEEMEAKLQQFKNSMDVKARIIDDLKRQLFLLQNPTAPSPRSPRYHFNKHSKSTQCNLFDSMDSNHSSHNESLETESVSNLSPPELSLNELSSDKSAAFNGNADSSKTKTKPATKTKNKMTISQLLKETLSSDDDFLYSTLRGSGGRGEASAGRTSEAFLRKKVKRLEEELNTVKYNRREHKEMKAMLTVMTDRHNKLKRKLKAASSLSDKDSAPKKKVPTNERKVLSNDNKAVIKDLQTKNSVLNGEIGRLRAKLVEMKQQRGSRNISTPSKLSIAERMKLRRRAKGRVK